MSWNLILNKVVCLDVRCLEQPERFLCLIFIFKYLSFFQTWWKLWVCFSRNSLLILVNMFRWCMVQLTSFYMIVYLSFLSGKIFSSFTIFFFWKNRIYKENVRIRCMNSLLVSILKKLILKKINIEWSSFVIWSIYVAYHLFKNGESCRFF